MHGWSGGCPCRPIWPLHHAIITYLNSALPEFFPQVSPLILKAHSFRSKGSFFFLIVSERLSLNRIVHIIKSRFVIMRRYSAFKANVAGRRARGNHAEGRASDHHGRRKDHRSNDPATTQVSPGRPGGTQRQRSLALRDVRCARLETGHVDVARVPGVS